MVVVRENKPPSWYSKKGSTAKYNQLVRKGLPSFKDWRFLTLTLDPKKFTNAEAGYQFGKDRLRYFFQKVKIALGIKHLRYFWKLEFQKSGWAHWHILLDYKRPVDINHIVRCWGNGDVDVKHCKDHKLPYLFKYLCKTDDDLPKWFLAYRRPRVFQSSNLYSDNVPTTDSEHKEPACTGQVGDLLGERLKRWASSIVVWFDGEELTYWGEVLVTRFETFWDMCEELLSESLDIFVPGSVRAIKVDRAWVFNNLKE